MTAITPDDIGALTVSLLILIGLCGLVYWWWHDTHISDGGDE